MPPTAAQLAELRRMTAEPTEAKYSDALLTTYIERWPLMDQTGQPPYFIQGYTKVANALWTPTYDMNRAAAEIWDEKAAALAEGSIDYSADGGQFSVRQAFQNAKNMAQTYRARRSPAVILFNPGPQHLSDNDLDRDDHN